MVPSVRGINGTKGDCPDRSIMCSDLRLEHWAPIALISMRTPQDASLSSLADISASPFSELYIFANRLKAKPSDGRCY
jgi:hypothetical protein